MICYTRDSSAHVTADERSFLVDPCQSAFIVFKVEARLRFFKSHELDECFPRVFAMNFSGFPYGEQAIVVFSIYIINFQDEVWDGLVRVKTT